ncbi:MAG: tRNA-(ms[2]io[6]A)-hydroxylase [Pseudomonadota bacterium]
MTKASTDRFRTASGGSWPYPLLAERLAPSPPGWLSAVTADLDAFLSDHASCEKKASGMALAVASHYPDKPALLSAMADLAVEELVHYREVLRLLLARGQHPRPDRKDPYINTLHNQLRRGSRWFLLDRLLIAAIVEARGFERFGLLANGLSEASLAAFYRRITASENRHWQLFLDLAAEYFPTPEIEQRLETLVAVEAEAMIAQPLGPHLH